MASQLFIILERLWIFLLSLFRGVDSPSFALPSSGNNRHNNNFTNDPLPKDIFLRHPSLRTSEGSRSRFAPEADEAFVKIYMKGQAFTPTFCIQDWSSIPACGNNAIPRSRPPRPPSKMLPSVIVTPCPPNDIGDVFDDFRYDVSPLERPIAPYCDANLHLSPDRIAQLKHETKDKKPSRLSADNTCVPFDFISGKLPRMPDRRSFVFQGSLANSSIKPILGKADSIIGASRGIPDIEPLFAFSLDPSMSRQISHVTGTPVKGRKLEALSDLELETDLNFFPRGVLLSVPEGEDEMDSLPYPDIFDIDLYYGALSDRTSIPRTSFSEFCLSLETMKPLLFPEFPSECFVTSPSKSEKRFGFIPEAHSTPRDAKILRDRYRPRSYSQFSQQYMESRYIGSFSNDFPSSKNGHAKPVLLKLSITEAAVISSKNNVVCSNPECEHLSVHDKSQAPSMVVVSRHLFNSPKYDAVRSPSCRIWI